MRKGLKGTSIYFSSSSSERTSSQKLVDKVDNTGIHRNKRRIEYARRKSGAATGGVIR